MVFTRARRHLDHLHPQQCLVLCIVPYLGQDAYDGPGVRCDVLRGPLNDHAEQVEDLHSQTGARSP